MSRMLLPRRKEFRAWTKMPFPALFLGSTARHVELNPYSLYFPPIFFSSSLHSLWKSSPCAFIFYVFFLGNRKRPKVFLVLKCRRSQLLFSSLGDCIDTISHTNVVDFVGSISWFVFKTEEKWSLVRFTTQGLSTSHSFFDSVAVSYRWTNDIGDYMHTQILSWLPCGQEEMDDVDSGRFLYLHFFPRQLETIRLPWLAYEEPRPIH